VRSDETLSRRSFRFSDAWQRTGGSIAPQIDARLAGVENRGDTLVVHSLSGGERNHYFSNRTGQSFTDLSALSGLDTPADSRGFAVLDYDRDGWQDIALVNANQPLFNLYHNEIAASGTAPRSGIIALRFIGGSRQNAPAEGLACRDGYGSKIIAELEGLTIIREHRCGDGYAAQHSATMLIGIGAQPAVKRLTVRWPSGRTTVAENVPEGTLLTVSEATDAPGGKSVTRQPYRVPLPSRSAEPAMVKISRFAAQDTGADPAARLRIYSSMATWCAACASHLPRQHRLVADLAGQGVALTGVPTDPEDDDAKLNDYLQKRKPPYRLAAAASAEDRALFVSELTSLLGTEPALPSTLVTRADGTIVHAMTGLPTVSDVRRWLAETK
jgi:hypothetical protein